MADYTFRCRICEHTETVCRSVIAGPPTDLIHCGAPMVRQYKTIMTMAFNPADILVSWSEENYARMRARKRGEQAPRYSPDHVNRIHAPVPGNNWNRK